MGFLILAGFVLLLVLVFWLIGKAVAKPYPEAGDTWCLYPDNPWDKREIRILDVKDGYVLYKYPHGGALYSMSVNSLHYTYTKLSSCSNT